MQRGSETSLSKADLDILTAQFPGESVGVKVQSFSKDRTKAMLVLYLAHTDCYSRIEQVDPGWSCEVLEERAEQNTIYIRMRMTVKGVARENVGEGPDPKSAYSDALKRCAMLFGVGRYLYDQENVWVQYDDKKDRFRTWTMKDFEAASPKRRASTQQAAKKPAPTAKQPAPDANQESGEQPQADRRRTELNRKLMNLYRPFLKHRPITQFAKLLEERYRVNETRLMTVEQIADLVKFMETQIQTVA